MTKTKLTKIFPSEILQVDAELGIVDAYVSIMGIVDDDMPPDIVEFGAFRKTLQERGPAGSNRIRVLRQHDWGVVIGKPLALVEHARDMLPAAVLERYPQATGGLFTRTQFVLSVQSARETYELIKAGAIGEWSIGFDVLQEKMDKVGGKAVRRIQEVRLWEYSPVTWGANPATLTVGVKSTDNEEAPVTPEIDGAEPSERTLTQKERMELRLRVREFEMKLNQNRGGKRR